MRKIFATAGLVAMLASCASEPRTIRREVEHVCHEETKNGKYLVHLYFSLENDFYSPKSVSFITEQPDTCYMMRWYDCPFDSINGVSIYDGTSQTTMMYE